MLLQANLHEVQQFQLTRISWSHFSLYKWLKLENNLFTNGNFGGKFFEDFIFDSFNQKAKHRWCFDAKPNSFTFHSKVTQYWVYFSVCKAQKNHKQKTTTTNSLGGGKTVMKFEVKWMLLGFGLHCKSFSYPVTTSSLKRIVSYSFQLLKAFQLFLLCKIFSIMWNSAFHLCGIIIPKSK